ncbi:MAG: PEP-CTERM sorting domain-containing protein [Rhodocyclaceae bacterium]|nr:PEP-CTERM sorting domain-containing protein [Rhodocyclaceae bacterium]MBX3668588.1 PEP-CTERM sorting domain-containing protein [Rhodocyclaceae bacterium]
MAKMKLLHAAAGMMLGLSATVASAAFVDIIEGAEGTTITINTNLTGPSGPGSSPTISAGTETASIDGYHFPAISPSPVTPGIFVAAGLVESIGGPLSDLVLLQASTFLDCGNIGICQRLTISFYSDVEGGPPLESLIPTAATFLGSMLEDGTLQDMSSLLGTLPEGLVLRVQSDTERVPEPASIALLAAGLAGLGFRKRKWV